MNYSADNSTCPELIIYPTDNTSGLPYKYAVMLNLELSKWAPAQALDDFDTLPEIKQKSINEERKRKISWK